MIQGFLALALFAATVYMAVQWQNQRRRRQAVDHSLQEQVGRRGVVTERIGADAGLVRINGSGYAACTHGADAIGPRMAVEVVGVQRYRLVVKKLEGHSQLIDVDHL